MPKFDYILVVSMAISLIWGIVVFSIGCVIRFNLAMFVNNYLEAVAANVNLDACKSNTDHICPVPTEVTVDVTLGHWTITLASLTIVCGFLTILFSVIGFVGGLKKNNPMLILVIIIDVAAMCTLYYLTHIVSSFTADFHDTAKDQLMKMMRAEYLIAGKDDNQFTKIMNGFMLEGECCGVLGPEDFLTLNLTWVDKESNIKYKFQVAPACCKRGLFDKAQIDTLLECSTKDTQSRNWNKEGCYKTIYDYIADTYGASILGLLLFLAIWLAIQLVLAILTVLTPETSMPPPTILPREIFKPVEEEFIRRSVEKKVPRKFMPFAKISSFEPSELDRIKSTEIW